jgi:hypothetical protein
MIINMPAVYILVAIALLILAVMLFYGPYRIHSAINREKEVLFEQSTVDNRPLTTADLERLPSNLSSFLIKTGVVGKSCGGNVIFRQKGLIKTAHNKKWRPFKAIQYMSGSSPGFIWNARSFPLFIRDKSVNGVGEVKVNLMGFKDVAIFGGGHTNKSALVRYLGELMFYPIGLLSKDISWEITSHNAIRASLIVNDVLAEGNFYFDEEGLLYRFESERYMGEHLENFTGLAQEYKMMSGLYLPTKMKAIWNLEQGDFEYFNAEITDYRMV